MELKQLQSLIEVIRCQSFTKAAEKLYISQPTISTHIRMLEEELRSRLIIRTTKSIEITPHGWELYECACRMLALRDGLVQRWAQENRNIISLGVSTIPADYILPEILPLFREACPEVQFHIHQSDSGGIVEGLRAGSFALGMIGMESSEEGIESIPFYRDSMVMITPVQERFAQLRAGSEELLDVLLREPVILREQGSGSRRCMESYFVQRNIDESSLHVISRLNDQESIKKLVAGGFGISFISKKAAEDYHMSGKLLSFELPGALAVRSLYFVYRKDYILKEHIRQFIGFVREYYSRKEEKEEKCRG